MQINPRKITLRLLRIPLLARLAIVTEDMFFDCLDFPDFVAGSLRPVLEERMFLFSDRFAMHSLLLTF